MITIDEQKDVFYLIDEITKEILEGYQIPNFTKEQVQKIVDEYNIDANSTCKRFYLQEIAHLTIWCIICDHLGISKEEILGKITTLEARVN